jgi:uncharacterized protein (TIGR02996 family)
MTERDALLRAVCAAPDDDLPRLVFADWCEENGEPERATFIRTQVEFARKSRHAEGVDDRLGRQSLELWREYRKRWLAELPVIRGVTWFDAFYRGFVERVSVTSDVVLMAHADDILGTSPIQHLTVGELRGVTGFSQLPALRWMKTLTVTVATDEGADELRRCDRLPDSLLLFCYSSANVSTDSVMAMNRRFAGQLFNRINPLPDGRPPP